MKLSEIIQAGMSNEAAFQVDEKHLALHVGSGASRVLATPWMIAFMEQTSHQLLAKRLPPGYSSVGVLVEVRHLAPTPLGSSVRIRSEVLEVDGEQVRFDVRAWDEFEQIGEGNHRRYVVDEARFLRRVEAKRSV